jgi:ABC-type branched-subunit amino acid transport system substrate-binding protein
MYFPIGNQFNGTAMLAYWPGTHHLIHKAAVMSVALAVSQQGCSTTVQELKALHIPVVYQASVPIGSTDLSSYVQQARAKGADGILQCFDITTSVVLMRALQQQNWHPYVASSSGAGDTQLLSAAPPKTLEGMQVNFPVPSFNDTTLPVIKNEYLPAYRAVAGPNAEQSDWGVRGFISVLLLQRAVQSAGPSRAAVINWLNHQKRLNLDGLLPPDQSYVPNRNGAHVEPKCSQVFTVHNAQFVSASHGWVCISAG